jgi:aminopeptidase N
MQGTCQDTFAPTISIPMKKYALLATIGSLMAIALLAQSAPAASKPAAATLPLSTQPDYQPTAEKKFDLRHVKLEVKFDYTKRRMNGKAWLTLAPHFYPQQVLALDAKGMFIHKVALVTGATQKPLKFDYQDSLQLKITLDKTYTRSESLNIYIEYTARPDEISTKGSAAITNAKGLYFINPDGKDSTKPIQIWTQGETEATSVWCPIIDKPNQKTTQEIAMTVPAKYVSLSNGVLVKQVNNNNGTRTDHWKMDQPHSPYLFFMGVGDFAVIKDKYKNIPVDYYVEKQEAPLAKYIFGDTPAMIEYFSKLVGLEYPWPKYAQMVGREYVSGAMENTTATLHGSAAYQNARQLKDGNSWEIVVAHELFHQWFGDLATTESWSNLTVNESFADYSEYLWLEYKYGKDHALAYNQEAMNGYMLNPGNSSKHLVRFQYADKEEMFDGVTYQKGGRIQNMLRYYVGDSAYCKAMQVYLQQNKFKNTEAHQWRLALEEVSGKDLNWFFDQWYYGSGHPNMEISTEVDTAASAARVILTQKQKGNVFAIPVEIDVYTQGKSKRITWWTKSANDTVTLNFESIPDWIDVDPSRLILWQKKMNQSVAAWNAQAKYASNYVQKMEVIEKLSSDWKEEADSYSNIEQMLNDKYFGTRKAALNVLRKGHIKITPSLLEKVAALAQNETNAPTRAYAIDVLSHVVPSAYESLFEKSCRDSSYSVAGAALEALARVNDSKAVAMAAPLKEDAKGRLSSSLQITDYLGKDTTKPAATLDAYKKLSPVSKIMEANAMLYFANRINEVSDFRKATGPAIEAYKMLRFDYQGMQTAIASTIYWMIHQRESKLKADPNNTVAKEQLAYLKEKSGF